MSGQSVLESLLIIPAFPFVLGLVVFFHELGHFWMARRFGVDIEAFSIGFGPELFAFVDRHGTRWRLAAVPLGGYVKFAGDLNGASIPDEAALAAMPPEVRRRSFYGQSVAKRSAIVAAGPVASFLLAIAIFSMTFMIFGIHTITPLVGGVKDKSPAMQAGFLPGDLITAINDRPIEGFADIASVVTLSTNDSLKFDVLRFGRPLVLHAVPRREVQDTMIGKAKVGQIGISQSSFEEDSRTQYPGPVRAVAEGAVQTWQTVTKTVTLVQRLVTGREAFDQLSGVVGIARGSGKIATLGIFYLILYAGVLSASIGFMNLLPIPLLDGGHLLYFFCEAVRRRPLTVRTQEFGFRVGLAFVALMMVFSNSNDLIRWFGEFIK